MRKRTSLPQLLATLAITCLAAACGSKTDRPPVVTTGGQAPPATTTVPQQSMGTRDEIIMERNDDLIASDRSDPLRIRELDIDSINDLRPLADIRFDYDSAVLSPQARTTLDSHAALLETYSTMTVLIEGHCDERGTVEYNLALGERRANSVLNYLTSLGINPTRLKTISYGKEFPEDPGHNEGAWSRNRRGHFEITAK